MELDVLRYQAKVHAAAHTSEYLYHQLIPYLGNKRKLLPLIAEAVAQTGVSSGLFADFFAGSGVVSRFAKQAGFQVIANDWEPYSQAINQCYIACNTLPAFAAFGSLETVYQTLNELPNAEGYVSANLCPINDTCPDPDTERLFFTRANGGKIDAIRAQIALWARYGQITPDEEAVLLASLVYAVSYVSNTSGVFKGFHRGWGGKTGTALYRILSTLTLRPPVLYDNGLDNRATQLDAQCLADCLRLSGERIAIAYLDPPYNQHPYGSNYHVLNTVALGDSPLTPGRGVPGNKSAIRTDWRTERRSAYNHRAALDAYQLLLRSLDARYILTSYSTDGLMPLAAMLDAAAERGRLSCVTHVYKRYRVSRQRMSLRPTNAEFVLIIDTQKPPRPDDAAQVLERITVTEQSEGLKSSMPKTL